MRILVCRVFEAWGVELEPILVNPRVESLRTKQNHSSYSEGKVVDAIKSTTFGTLYDLPSFGYPAMAEGTGVVRGYLLSFADDSWMTPIDGLEEYDPKGPMEENVYNRVKIDVYSDDGSYLGKHWGYSMKMSRIRSFGGVLIESGEWSPKSSN